MAMDLLFNRPGIASQCGLHYGLTAVNGGRSTAECRIGPVAASQDHVIEHARVVEKRIAAKGHRANQLLDRPAGP